MWWLALVALAALIAAPYLLEARRRPMNQRARADAPGAFAHLTDGVTHYEWHGAKDGQVLVCIHGLTTPGWVFSGLVRGLAMMGYRVLVYDLYGRGYSDRPKMAQTRRFFLRQLNELLVDQKINAEVVLLGYSMGGAIATAFAADAPDRVDRLILLAPAGIDYTPAPLLKKASEWGVFGDWLWGLFGARHLRRAARKDAMRPTIIPDLPARMTRETSRQGYLRSVLSAQRNMLSEMQEDEHRELAKIYVAVVSIWGEKDDVIPLSSVGKLSEWNRDAYKFVVPGASHALGYTNPKEVLAAIQENLREV